MVVSVRLRGENHVLPVFQEVEVVVHVDPAVIRVFVHKLRIAGLAVDKVKVHFRLETGHRPDPQLLAVRKPSHPDDVFKPRAIEACPCRLLRADLDYADFHGGILFANLWITLGSHCGSPGLEVDVVLEAHFRFIRLQVRDGL